MNEPISVPGSAASVAGARQHAGSKPNTPLAKMREWEQCQHITNLPGVHGALHEFSEDATGDNGVYVVREVLRAVAQEARLVNQPAPLPGCKRDAALLDLREFEDGQWWVKELDEAVQNGTADQKRAVAVVRNMLKVAALAAHPPVNVSQAAESGASPDPVVETNVALMRQRSIVGIEQYGTTLAASGLSVRALLVHALEESLDQANYIQAAIQATDSASRPAAAALVSNGGAV